MRVLFLMQDQPTGAVLAIESAIKRLTKNKKRKVICIFPLAGTHFMQGQRFWIERAFEDCKGSLGMSEYQLRKWRGWHHHMTLVLMAKLFLLREQIHNADAYPLLSCQDVVSMLAFYLPKRDVTENEMFRQLKTRHRKRQDDIDRGKH
jgi:hypothetical protein